MTLRPPEDDDFDAMLELMNAHQLAAFGEADATEDELRTWLTSPSVEIERDIRVLERDGRLVGYVGRRTRAGTTRRSGGATSRSLPTSMPDAVVGRARRRGSTSATDDGQAAGVDVSDRCARRRRSSSGSASRRSATPTGWRSTSTADARDTGVARWDHRFEPSTTGEDRCASTRRSSRSGRTRSDPLRRDVRGVGALETRTATSYDPLLWFLALAGDELAGFSRLPRKDIDRFGRLRRAARRSAAMARQGLGEALLLHSFQAFRRAWLDAWHARRRRVEPDRRDPALRAGRDARLPGHALPRTAGSRVGSSV